MVHGITDTALMKLINDEWDRQLEIRKFDDQSHAYLLGATEELIRALEEHGKKYLGNPVELLRGMSKNLEGWFVSYEKGGQAKDHTDLPPGGVAGGFGPEEVFTVVFVLKSSGEGLRISTKSKIDGLSTTRTYSLPTGSFILFPSGLWHESEPAIEDGRLILSVMFGVSRGPCLCMTNNS